MSTVNKTQSFVSSEEFDSLVEYCLTQAVNAAMTHVRGAWLTLVGRISGILVTSDVHVGWLPPTGCAKYSIWLNANPGSSVYRKFHVAKVVNPTSSDWLRLVDDPYYVFNPELASAPFDVSGGGPSTDPQYYQQILPTRLESGVYASYVAEAESFSVLSSDSVWRIRRSVAAGLLYSYTWSGGTQLFDKVLDLWDTYSYS